MLSLWNAVWQSTALPLLCDRAWVTSLTSKVRNPLSYTLVLCYQMTLCLTIYIHYIGGFVPFLPIPPFFEISCLDKTWEVNEFKYISHPLIFL